MDLREWERGGRRFEHDGRGIFYRTTEGDGPVLLCLHGFPTSSYDYHKIWDRLAERFSLLACDMIGYGLSAKPRRFDYTTFAQTDLLEALVGRLGIEELHILAHDYGNTITQELLARAEEGRLGFRIETICFMNGALFPETHRPILAQKILISPVGAIFGRLIPRSAFRRSLASVFGPETQPDEAEMDDLIALFERNGGRRISHRLIRYMSERARYRERWVGALERMEQPFRFINGLDDPVSGRHLVERFREVLPDQRDIVELPGVGHFPHLEVPDVLLGHFFDFHDRTDRSAAG